MNELTVRLSALKIVPVIVLENAESIVPVGDILVRNGLPIAEVTFRTQAAAKAIELLRAAQPSMLIAAGTVLSKQHINEAQNAGADFIVSPGLNEKNIAFAQDRGIPFIPGVNNPSDVESAIELGLDTVKFFPAEASGGLGMLRALSGPYGQIKFFPTGGIGLHNIREYLSLSSVVACGGSWMVDPQLINAGNWDEIDRRVREVVELICCNPQ